VEVEQLSARADEALRLVQIDLDHAIRLATATLEEARRLGDKGAASVSERALGLAAVHRQDLDAARQHLRAAIRYGRDSDRAELAAEARMTYAFALNRAGLGARAIAEIDAALGGLGHLRRAEGLVQRAAIMQQLGRLDEALRDYQTALPTLRRAADGVWVQRALLNRGVLHAFRHSYSAALRDLHEAQRLSGELGLQLPAAFVHENLLLVHRRLGDVPTALDHLSQAERIYHRLGAPVGSLLVERSELLLSVGLFTEAREAAEEAVSQFTRSGRHQSTPEARLLLARTAALTGDLDRAIDEARRAIREFGRQGRQEWLLLAECALILAQLEQADHGRLTLRTVVDLADRAERAGWPATALDVRLAAGQYWLTGRQRAGARHQLGIVSAGRRSGTALRRVKGWYATALLHREDRDLRRSSRAAARGLTLLDEYRNTVSATDIRARISSLGLGLASIGLRNSLDRAAPIDVLKWAERGRARHLLQQSARPPSDPELALLTAQLRAVVAEQLDRRLAGKPSPGLAARQRSLEVSIRDVSRRSVSDVLPPPPPASLADLSSHLADAALIEFVDLDGVLQAVTLADGRLGLHPLGPTKIVEDLIRWVPFALNRLARHRTDRPGAAAAMALVEGKARVLDDLLLAPLQGNVRDRPLVVVPTGVLQSLPWSLLPSLRGQPVTVAPSAAMWAAACDAEPVPGPAVVVAGPRLPGAHLEAVEVAETYGVRPLVGPAATIDAVTRRARGAAVFHVAAHGTVRADNPLFSAVHLADGPLTVYDLEHIDGHLDTVVLAACESGHNVVLAGDELIGLSAAFLSRATRHVIASVVSLPDASTRTLMARLHRALDADRPVAEALGLAQAEADLEPADFAAAAGFICLGHGFSPIARRNHVDDAADAHRGEPARPSASY
jgi:tetratricopeptide (TPR) repeat protein